MRYYLGVDWADQTHAVWVGDERGTKITARMVPHTAEGMTEWGRELDEWRAQGIELWAAIERPEGRVVDFLLDHGVVVYPVNPKVLDRARDRFRQGGAKSDPFDARVLAEFLRTDHPRLRALQPSSEAAQELKLLTVDCQRQIRQQTRLVNQLTATLKAYYPRGLEVAELTTTLAREFLQAYLCQHGEAILLFRWADPRGCRAVACDRVQCPHDRPARSILTVKGRRRISERGRGRDSP
jgi:transposase